MPITLKKASQTISIKWSASHMSNNLTIHRSSESRRSTMYGVSHKSGFTMVKIRIIRMKIICLDKYFR
jgi:hypothetical protein